MTPERRAEIEAKINAPYAEDVDGYRSTEMKCSFMDAAIPEELLAEIDRLNKVVDQAIRLAHIEILPEKEVELDDGSSGSIVERFIICGESVHLHNGPDLADHLRERRSKA